MKPLPIILLTLALAVPATWWATRHFAPSNAAAPAAAGKKVLYYQSPMHPWIKSDKPGRCTICGMELTPIYEGEEAMQTGEHVIPLSPATQRALNVETAKAETTPLDRELHVAGMIDDDDTRHRILSAYVDGRIDKLHVNYVGAEVSAGQPLAEFYSPMLLQTAREYRALTGELKRAAAIRLKQMGLNEAQIEELASQPADQLTVRLLAPMTGTVVARKVYEGQYVKEGDPLFEIADFSTMWFLFDAYENDLPWLKAGQEVEVIAPALPGKSFTGKITFINPNLDDATRSAKVRVELPNPLVEGKRELLHKLYAEARVTLESPAVLSIPRAAVIEAGPRAIVFVGQGEGAFERREVKLGLKGATRVEVLAGLNEGETVVTSGNLLMDGQAELSGVPAKPAPMKGPDESARPAIEAFLKTADALAAALAKDDLAAFNQAGEHVMHVTGDLVAALQGRPELADKLAAVEKAQHFHGSPDLKAARKQFYAFTTAAVNLLAPMRRSPGTPEFQIWRCPMVDEAVPGASKKTDWIQLGKRPIGNPFFGKEMLECGEEIQP
jgi:Cu(I)/Ag(I) efflux system membrane fusion protein